MFLKGGMCANSRNSVNRFKRFSLIKRLLVFALPFIFFSCGAIAQNEAQPPIPVATLLIGGKTVSAEIADEEHERSNGLMFRKSLPSDHCMLFIMPSPGPVGFWMKNTTLPLTIAYIDRNGTIMELHDLTPLDETPVKSRFQTITYALEMPQGWFHSNNIWPGQRILGLPKTTVR